MFEAWDSDVWFSSNPHRFLGLHIGARQIVVRLPSGDLVTYSPVPMTDERRAAVDAMGTLRHIVCPNAYHHLFAGEWARAYPNAALYAPPALKKKRKDLPIAHLLDGQPVAALSPAIDLVTIHGTMFQETVMVHRPSRTLICADLVENFATSPHWPTRLYLKAAGIHGQPGVPRPLRPLYRRRAEARESLSKLFATDFDRVICAHGDPIRSAGKATVEKALSWV